MNDGVLQTDASLETTAKTIRHVFDLISARLLIDKRKQLHCTSGLDIIAVNSELEGEIGKKVRRKKGGGSKTCDCHRQNTKTEIMSHIQEIFSCWNKLGARNRRRVRSVYTHTHRDTYRAQNRPAKYPRKLKSNKARH